MQAGVLLAVGAGGALGALARYAGTEILRSFGDGFPFATFAINVVGCFLFGLCYALHVDAWSKPQAAGVLVGFLGAFTTFSTFAFEGLSLIEQGRYLAFAGNLVGQNVLGVLGVLAGLSAGRAL